MTETEPNTADRYIGSTRLVVDLRGAPFILTIHLGVISQRAACVGMDVRAFINENDHPSTRLEDVNPQPIAGWQELTTARWRDVRVREAVQQSIVEHRALLDDVLAYEGVKWAPGEVEKIAKDVTALLAAEDGGSRRPGRPAALSDDAVLGIVARAFREHRATGGSRPVVAVQQALEEAGVLPGAGATGEVTIHQARAAVRRARKLLAERGEEL